jgi:hypothetical protein
MNEAVQVQESDQRSDLVVRRGGGRRRGDLAEAEARALTASDRLLWAGWISAALIWGWALII